MYRCGAGGFPDLLESDIGAKLTPRMTSVNVTYRPVCENRLLIGSAAATPYAAPDWQESAVATAWHALTQLHERAMRR